MEEKMKKVIIVLIVVFMVFLDAKVSATGSSVYLCGIHDSDGADRTSWISTSKNYYINGAGATVTTKEYFTASNLAYYIKISDVLVIHSHGAYNKVKAVDSSGTSSYLYKNTIDGYSSNYLSGTQLVFLAACECAYGGTNGNNIAKSLYNKGVSTVIGYSDSVNTAANRKFISEFNSSYAYGTSVSTALLVALQRVNNTYGDPYGTDSYVVFGSSTATIQNNSGNIYMSNNLAKGREYYYGENGEITGYFDFDLAEGNKTEKDDYPDRDLLTEHYQLTDYYFDDSTGMYISRFNYYINNEIKTSDRLCLVENNKGEIVSYIQPEKNKFNDVSVSSHEITNAIMKAEVQIQSENWKSYTLRDTVLTIDKENVALECSFLVDNGEYREIEVIRIEL